MVERGSCKLSGGTHTGGRHLTIVPNYTESLACRIVRVMCTWTRRRPDVGMAALAVHLVPQDERPLNAQDFINA